MKIRFLLTALLLVGSSGHAALTIQVNDSVYLYEDPVRLSRVLLPLGEHDNWYWPASRLFDLNDRAALREKQQIIYDIDKLLLTMDRDGAEYTSLQAVRLQLKNLSVNTRLNKAVSFYPARISVENNPMFSKGRYLLRLTERPKNIDVLGAVRNARRYPHAGNETLVGINSHIDRLPGADNSFVYLIYPDGRVFKEGSAYWNRSYAPVMPGSTIYVPVAADNDSAITDLNKRIAELVVHREGRND